MTRDGAYHNINDVTVGIVNMAEQNDSCCLPVLIHIGTVRYISGGDMSAFMAASTCRSCYR